MQARGRRPGRVLIALALLAATSAAAGTPAAPDGDLLRDLVARARDARLAEDPGWLKLGHWRRTWWGGWRSDVAGREFFRAPSGRTDPAAELEATLASFLAPAPATGNELDDPRCRFPARLLFLQRRLGLDPAWLPPSACPRRDDFLARLAPKGATLVFSSWYLNSPASAFGHTLLRLDKAESARGGKHYEILDYAANYTAKVDTSNGFLYAMKGLFGLFSGEWAHFAYYYKIREYADFESRDLWAYDLDLSPDEIALLAAHLWEVGGAFFRYWFLDKNCSYEILAALEAAAPRLDLLPHAGRFFVLPSDTVKALFLNPGLVKGIQYRPSIRTQFQERLARLSGRERDVLDAVARNPGAPLAELSDAERAAVLDAAVDLVDLAHARSLAQDKDPVAAAVRQALLERRAGIRVPSPELEIAVPEWRRPELAHGSSRAGAGGGVSRREGGIAVLDLRAALHDFADPPVGSPDIAAIEFLPVRLRVAPRSGRVELDDASLVRATALSPAGRFESRMSWTLRVGAATVRDAGCDRCLAGVIEGGGGVAVANAIGVADLAAFGETSVEGSPRLAGIEGSPLRVGLGPSALVRIRAGERATFLATARWRWLPLATPWETWALGATLRLHLGPDLSLSLEGRRMPRDDDAVVSLLAYF